MKNTRSWRACALATVTVLAVGCSHPPPPDPNAPPTPRAVQTTVDQQHATQDAAVEDQSK